MFTEMQPPLAPEVALPILTSEAPSLCAPYLQAALAAHTAAPEVFHTELALIYLRSALEQHKPGAAQGVRPSGASIPLRGHCYERLGCASWLYRLLNQFIGRSGSPVMILITIICWSASATFKNRAAVTLYVMTVDRHRSATGSRAIPGRERACTAPGAVPSY